MAQVAPLITRSSYNKEKQGRGCAQIHHRLQGMQCHTERARDFDACRTKIVELLKRQPQAFVLSEPKSVGMRRSRGMTNDRMRSGRRRTRREARNWTMVVGNPSRRGRT